MPDASFSLTKYNQGAGKTGSAQKGVTSFWDGTCGTSPIALKWQFIQHLLEKQLSLECSFILKRWNIYSSISHNPFQKRHGNSNKISLPWLHFHVQRVFIFQWMRLENQIYVV